MRRVLMLEAPERVLEVFTIWESATLTDTLTAYGEPASTSGAAG
jgi:hypothetical protein